MRLKTVWIVRDPSPQSELVDIVFEMDVPRVGDYVIGGGPGVWQREHHAVFTDKDEAVAERVRRLLSARPDREGWINDEAYRVFAYGAPRRDR